MAVREWAIAASALGVFLSPRPALGSSSRPANVWVLGPNTQGTEVRATHWESEVATRTEVLLIDDLDGSEATETVRFSLDGRAYEIDLSAKNASALRLSVQAYVDAARRVVGRARRSR